MQLRDILQDKQPNTYGELKKLQPKKRKRKKKKNKNKDPHNKANRKVKATEQDIKECMSHGAWRRGSGGSIKQFRW